MKNRPRRRRRADPLRLAGVFVILSGCGVPFGAAGETDPAETERRLAVYERTIDGLENDPTLEGDLFPILEEGAAVRHVRTHVNPSGTGYVVDVVRPGDEEGRRPSVRLCIGAELRSAAAACGQPVPPDADRGADIGPPPEHTMFGEMVVVPEPLEERDVIVDATADGDALRQGVRVAIERDLGLSNPELTSSGQAGRVGSD